VSAPEIDAATAVARLSAAMEPVRDRERCNLGAAGNRVLAEDLVAALDVPGFDNAAMDGYAVRAVDCTTAGALRVVGRALAGHPYAAGLNPGEAVRIMTGAAVPAGADAVVMQEEARVDGDRVALSAVPQSGLNIRPRAEHLRAGSVALPRGRRLRDYDLGLAAVAGAAELQVLRALRVGVLSTGDELHDPPQPVPAAGQYDGNRPMLLAALARSGYQIHDLGIVVDRAEALVEAIGAAAQSRLDVVISSGGVAQGDADVVRRFPALQFVPLAMRPGRGLACGRVEAQGQAFWLFGLPGNSVAAYVIYQLVVAPLLAHLAGAKAEAPLQLRLPLAVDAHTRPGRIDWRRGRFVGRHGALAIEPLPQQGSSMLRTLSDADALVAIGPAGTTPSGEPVDVIPFAALR
jgi:molybdopterin molybdotransferase